jgi:glycosyltransferase involved in cell wall biosynthesis
MLIGIDATSWANERGYGRYTRELVSAMTALDARHEFVCLLDALSAERFALERPNVRAVVVEQGVAPTVAAASGGRRSARDMLRLTRAVRREHFDVFFSPSVYGYFPLPPGLPAVVVIHDAIAERYPELTLPGWRDRLFWRLKVRLALRQATKVLTVSDHAAREIAEILGVPIADLGVTHEAVSDVYRPSESDADVRAAAERVGVPPGGRWLIYVGGFAPHKRIDLIVRAHAAVARRHTSKPLSLLLVGPSSDAFHQDLERIRATVRECGTEGLVRWPGYLPDEELRHLHSGAVALVLPSMAEGFGLPAVEAARCGAPVVATTASPLPDVLKGGGLFVPPGDLAALETAIDRLVSHEPDRQAMGRRALARASELSWPRSAAVALAAILEAGARRLRQAG